MTQPGWRSMDEAPRTGAVVDVWIRGASEDVCFHCPGNRYPYSDGTYGGASSGWYWRDGKWRPLAGLMSVPTFVIPAYWRPPYGPPEQDRGELA